MSIIGQKSVLFVMIFQQTNKKTQEIQGRSCKDKALLLRNQVKLALGGTLRILVFPQLLSCKYICFSVSLCSWNYFCCNVSSAFLALKFRYVGQRVELNTAGSVFSEAFLQE